MSAVAGARFQYGGWQFLIPSSAGDLSPWVREHLVQTVLDTVAGRRGAPYRRSRHATTWRVQVRRASGESVTIFVKQLDPLRGLQSRLKSLLRAHRFEHVVRMSSDLRRDGFGAPRVLIAGRNPSAGCEVIVSLQVPGAMVTRLWNPQYRETMDTRRAVLRALGAEVARLHQRGYVHGDLTPYNIFVTGNSPIRFAFIDHERTWRASRLALGIGHQRMRNLVQLGHFDIPGMSRSDRLRVFAAYADSMGLPRRKSLRRLVGMIGDRLGRDRRRGQDERRHAIIAREGHVGGG